MMKKNRSKAAYVQAAVVPALLLFGMVLSLLGQNSPGPQANPAPPVAQPAQPQSPPASPAASPSSPGLPADAVVGDSFQSIRDVADRLKAEYEDLDAKTWPDIDKLMRTKVCQINRISPLLERAEQALSKWLDAEKQYWQLWGDAEARRVEGQQKSLVALLADQEIARTEVDGRTKDRQALMEKRAQLEQTRRTEEIRQQMDALLDDIKDSEARLADAQKRFDDTSKLVTNMQASMSARLIEINQNSHRLTDYGLQMDSFYKQQRASAQELCNTKQPDTQKTPLPKGRN